MKNQTYITQLHLQVLYRTMLKRIGKGYSTQELSFLIGKSFDYVKEVEMLVLPLYTDAELKVIAAALDEDHIENLLLAEDDEIEFAVAVEIRQEELTLTRAYYSIQAEDVSKLLFMLKEEVLKDFDDDPAEAACLDCVTSLINSMVASGYFLRNRTALEIFRALRNLTAFELTPFLLDWALDGLTDEENPDRLLLKSVDNGVCLGYQSI